MSWEKSNYTAAGAALLSESLSGGALVITRAVSGTGTADADLSEETGVSGETHDLKLLDIETVESNGETARRVKIQITGADETYIMHQVGVYGRLNDDAETLLFIMQDERGVEVPSTKVNGDFEIELSALLAVSNKANISITVDPQMQALAKMVRAEVEKHNKDASAHTEAITAAVGNAMESLKESGGVVSEEQVKALIQEQGSSGGAAIIKDITIPADGWDWQRESDDEEMLGMDDFRCVVNVTVDGVTEDMFPSVALHKAALEVAKRAGLCPTVQALAGVLRFWARNIPTADMSATVALWAPGGTTGGGSAYVLAFPCRQTARSPHRPAVSHRMKSSLRQTRTRCWTRFSPQKVERNTGITGGLYGRQQVCDPRSSQIHRCTLAAGVDQVHLQGRSCPL